MMPLVLDDRLSSCSWSGSRFIPLKDARDFQVRTHAAEMSPLPLFLGANILL